MMAATANERDETSRLRGTIFVTLIREGSGMRNTGLGRGVVHRLGVAAAAIFALATVSQRAEALSLANSRRKICRYRPLWRHHYRYW
jgi:hypothetical protein